MNDLFDNNGAEFSKDRKYRYALWRIWDNSKPLVMFIGLNPSTANENTLDPTITRVKGFASTWGYGGFYMMNLFALVSSNPDDLLKSDDPLGDNDGWIEKVIPKCEKIIFAWGSFSQAVDRAKLIADNYTGYALDINKDGSPRHPLFVPSKTETVLYQTSRYR